MKRARTEPTREASSVTTTSSPASDGALEALLAQAAPLSEPAGDDARGALTLGSTLAGGRLQVLRLLGRGGMGHVYEAFDGERRERVALKVLARLTPDGVYRLKNEFRAMARLVHPNLVRLHELFADDGRWFYTMERVDGVPFDRHVRCDGALVLARLRPALAQLVGGMRAIHAAGKVHRDLKPSNVLVDARGRVVVLDFGLVTDARPGGVGQTRSQPALCGTPAYMAPEQAAGRAATTASDLYAVGVMLFEALCDQRPFTGTEGELLAAKQRDRAPSPRARSAGLPDDLVAACEALLELDAARRPDTAQLLAMLGARDARRAQPPPRPPLLGRDRELGALRDAFLAARAGRPVVVCVDGESGIGKTALCEAALSALAHEQGAVVLAGRCHERESVPFKAFDGLIDATCRHLRLAAPARVAALLPREAGALKRVFSSFERVASFAAVAPAVGTPADLQQRAFAGYVELLARMAKEQPLAVWLDDAHWSDADSLTLLEYLLTHLSGPLLVLVGRRDGAGRGGALAQLLVRVADQRRVRVDSLVLAPLVADATARVVEAIAPGLASRDAVVHSAAGNPLFAVQLARFAAQRGDATLPSFDELIAARAAALGASAAELLALLAFAGEPVLARAALAAADASSDDVEQLCALQLARVEASHGAHGSGKTLACYHDRIRAALAARLSAATRLRCAEQLARALCALDVDSLELLCRCRIAAGDLVEARRLTRVAAERAMAALAFDRAAALYARVLAAGDADAETCALHRRHGEALEAGGRAVAAAAAYRRAAALTRGPEQLALVQRAAAQLLFAGAYAEGLPLLEQVCRALKVPVPRSALGDALRLVALKARLERRGLGFEVAAVSPEAETRLELFSLVALTVLNYRSPLHGLCAVSRFLLRALDGHSYRHALQALGLNAITQAQISPDGAWCQRLVTRLSELASAHDDPIARAYASFVRGAVAHEAGRFEQARVELAQALAGYRTLGGSLHVAVDIALLYEQRNDDALGRYAKLAAETPAAIGEAYRRGRAWLGAMLLGPTGIVAFLLDDDVEAARRRLEEARGRYRPAAELQSPDVALHLSEVALLLYMGEPSQALALHALRLPALTRALGARSSAARVQLPIWTGKLALAALAAERAHGTRRRALRAMIGRAAQEAARGRRWHVHHAHLFEAGLALELGRHEEAARQLERLLAEARLPAHHMCAVAVGHRLGELRGGTHGRALIDGARCTLDAHGVRDRSAMIELFAPGLRLAQSS